MFVLSRFTLPKEMKSFEAVTRFMKIQEFTNDWHHFVMDKHFLTFDLFTELSSKDCYITTCLASRSGAFLFKNGLAKGLPKWRSRFAKQGNITAKRN